MGKRLIYIAFNVFKMNLILKSFKKTCRKGQQDNDQSEEGQDLLLVASS